MTDSLWFHWSLTHDASVVPMLAALGQSALTYPGTCGTGCVNWSDQPMWDSVVDSHIYDVTGTASLENKAKLAFEMVDKGSSYQRGACPSVDFQRPLSAGYQPVKALETDAGYIRAALLLFHDTNDTTYLQKAQDKYAAIRPYFLDPSVALYTNYILDDGTTCTQIPRRFFASVNGLMISNGIELAARTGKSEYLNDAIATGQAVAQYLNDASGSYANLQADNDLAEPLVEAMYALATSAGQTFARNWILASAAGLVENVNGGYGRFTNGPAAAAPSTIFQSNGGISLAIAAAALAPTGTLLPFWSNEQYVADNLASAPATVTFTGKGIALIGTIGEQCCRSGHARVFVDGVETFDQTGIWQNKSSANRTIPNSVLFAWRFPQSGKHTITIQPGIYNVKEGGSFFHMVGYDLVP